MKYYFEKCITVWVHWIWRICISSIDDTLVFYEFYGNVIRYMKNYLKVQFVG